MEYKWETVDVNVCECLRDKVEASRIFLGGMKHTSLKQLLFRALHFLELDERFMIYKSCATLQREIG